MSSEVLSSLATGERIVLITPVRDEEGYIGQMIESIAAQDLPPTKWIIVDDGSEDATRSIVQQYARKHPYITLMELPVRSERKPGGEGAVGHALRDLNLQDFDFIARFDADLVFPKDYLANIVREFCRDAALGIAGGALLIRTDDGWQMEKAPEYHVRGALKMYRRSCFEQLGGLFTQIGWDTIDEVSAWTKGWRTKSFLNYQVIHRRPTGGELKANRVYWERGRAEYLTCSHPLFVFVKSCKLAWERRAFIEPLCFLVGFVAPYVRRSERLRDGAFVRMRREQQIKRMKDMFLSHFSIGKGAAARSEPVKEDMRRSQAELGDRWH